MTKLKYKPVLQTLQNVINKEYSHSDLSADLAEYGITVSGNALSNRYSNDGYLKENEIDAIQKKYSINLFGNDSENDFITADYYEDVFGSCGNGVLVLSENKRPISIPKECFNHFSSVKKYSVINAVGNSMEPVIYEKDKLIVEHFELGEQIRDNHIYVFCYKDEIFVKRLIKNIDEIVVKSDNQSPEYRIKFIEKENMNDVKIIGQIVGLMRRM